MHWPFNNKFLIHFISDLLIMVLFIQYLFCPPLSSFLSFSLSIVPFLLSLRFYRCIRMHLIFFHFYIVLTSWLGVKWGSLAIYSERFEFVLPVQRANVIIIMIIVVVIVCRTRKLSSYMCVFLFVSVLRWTIFLFSLTLAVCRPTTHSLSQYTRNHMDIYCIGERTIINWWYKPK